MRRTLALQQGAPGPRMREVSPNPVLVATDLSEASDPAIARGAAHAQAVGAPLVVCHVIPDVLRSHPLQPRTGVNELTISSDYTKRAAELVTEQMRRVARTSLPTRTPSSSRAGMRRFDCGPSVTPAECGPRPPARAVEPRTEL